MATETRLPEVGEYIRGHGTLVEVQDVTPKEVVLDYIFESTTARVEGRINGKIVKEYGTFNNFYGKDTCVEHAIHEAKQQQTWLGESNMEFVVVKVTSHTRMRPGHSENYYQPEFLDMESLSCGSKWNLPDDKEEVVWRSSEADAVESK